MKNLKFILLIVINFFIMTNICNADIINPIKEGDRTNIKVHISTPSITIDEYIYNITKEKTGELLFSLQPECLFKAGDYRETAYKETAGLKFTDEEWTHIKRIAFLGYNYPGRTEAKWYPITQYLIWEYILRDTGEIYFIDENNQKVNYYEAEIAELKKELEHYFIIPSFFNFGIDSPIKTVKQDEVIELIDNLNVLKEYKITADNPSVKTKVEENKLYISFSYPTSSLIYASKPHLLKSFPNIYYAPNSPALMSRGIITQPGGTIVVSARHPKLTIKKGDSKKTNLSLKGAEYTIYSGDGNIFDHVVTNDEGIAELPEISEGEYTIIETKAPVGFKPDSTPKKLTISKKDVTLKLSAEPLKKEVTITRYLETSANKLISAPNAKFKVVNCNNKTVKVITTDTFGKASISLDYGCYKIIQTKEEKGYLLSPEISLEINDNYQEKNIIIKNKEIVGTLNIAKIDQETKQPLLTKTVFEIKNKDTSTIKKVTLTDKISLSLPYGTYEIKEIEAPTGYELNSKKYTITIKENKETKELVTENKKIYGTLKLNQIDSETKDIIKSPSKYELKNISTSEITIINMESSTILKVPYGNYELKEIEAPFSYNITLKPKRITIKTSQDIIDLTIQNKALKETINLKKVDSETKEAITISSTFELIDLTRNTTKKIALTSSHLPLNLLYGSYELREITPPNGYELNAQKYSFTIKDTQDNQELILENKKIYGTLTITQIDALTNKIINLDTTFELKNTSTGEINKITFISPTPIKIPYGLYELRMIESPLNYHLNSNTLKFEINKSATEIKLEIKSTPKTGNLEILKMDSLTNKPLKNIAFGLFDQENNLLEEIKTNDNGMITLQSLPIGNYILKELSLSNSEAISLNIKDATTSKVTIANRFSVNIPATSAKELLITIIVCLIIFLIGAILCNHDQNN